MKVLLSIDGRYLTGLTSSVIPGQSFGDERVKPETGKYTLAKVKVDPHELKFLSGGATPHGVPTFPRGSRHHLSILQVENWAVGSLPPGCSVLCSRCCCCPCS